MNVIISNTSNKPIYEQIIAQIKEAIMSGNLQSGNPLPSMRALAKSLHISVITTQRAYEDLQRDGFIETVTGKGTFVAIQNKDFIMEEQRKRIEVHIQEVVDIAKMSGITLESVVDILRIFYQEEE